MITWGSFGIVHMLTFLAAIGIILALYYLLRHRSARVQTLVLGILSLSGVAAIVFNLIAWDSPVEYLPLHLCSLTAIVLPIAVFTRSQRLCNLLLLWSLGAIMAIVINTAQADYDLLSWTFAFYYFPHTMQFGIPILMFSLGLARKEPRCIGSTLGITAVAYTIVHLCNVVINHFLAEADSAVRVNYMYSIKPENPVLAFFWELVPHPYWYMLLVLPVILVYLGLMYAPEIRRALIARRRTGRLTPRI